MLESRRDSHPCSTLSGTYQKQSRPRASTKAPDWHTIRCVGRRVVGWAVGGGVGAGIPEGSADLEGIKDTLGAEEGLDDLEGFKLGPDEG